ncbi:hypothetical protein JOB18_045153 [Solea senegalensis]|uniref:Uncharacterized protein n=1 Tax=Solea senegalensis TaxID=28829 RepID=A0AAV6RKJ9_SOLSE|nr:hypothetical protein JOB18_045153 [Solea senegalensis]
MAVVCWRCFVARATAAAEGRRVSSLEEGSKRTHCESILLGIFVKLFQDIYNNNKEIKSNRTLMLYRAECDRLEKDGWRSEAHDIHLRILGFIQQTNAIMQQRDNIFPGRKTVTFRRGPRGYLLQQPSDAAKLLKDNPSLQDKSAPLREDAVGENALTVVRVRGGDASDKTEVLGEYILQFGKYKGKSFRWLLENDVGYTIYLIQHVEKEEAAGVSMTQGHNKDSILSFVRYACSFRNLTSLVSYQPPPKAASEDEQLVGFGARSKSTWREVWDSRADGYAAFILKMMDDDEELERAMLSTEELVECTAAPSSSSLSAEVQPSPATQTGSVKVYACWIEPP